MLRPKMANDEIYHIYNRGVEKRQIFMDNSDYFRFIHNLFEFNDEAPALNLNYNLSRAPEIATQNASKRKRKLLVDILAFCLMPTHFHMMVRQRVDWGISKFMQKLGIGYTNYFNTKSKRAGVLFQGKYKAKIIDNEAYFIYLPHYIHLNPLDLTDMHWREGKVNNVKKVLEFLASYRWSAYLDYIGIKNFPSVTQREFLLGYFDEEGGYQESVANWLKAIELDKIKEVIIE